MTVKAVPKDEEHLVDKSKAIAAPMRYVRTNKGRLGEALLAKSRLVLPGHRDPQTGLCRTDARLRFLLCPKQGLPEIELCLCSWL